MKPLATYVHHQTVCEVVRSNSIGDVDTIARFYTYKGSKSERSAMAESMAAIFLHALKAEGSPSRKFKHRLQAVIKALHRGAIKWNESGSWGFRWAGLLALVTDALLYPGEYLYLPRPRRNRCQKN